VISSSSSLLNADFGWINSQVTDTQAVSFYEDTLTDNNPQQKSNGACRLAMHVTRIFY
jgi:hypothetical protein